MNNVGQKNRKPHNILYICFDVFGFLMQLQAIHEKIMQYRQEGKKLFATSSFQTNSVVLLHLLSLIDKSIPIYFINTGFHFPETIQYKDTVTRLLNVLVVDLLPHVPKAMQCNASGDLMFTFDPDYCCYLNKVQPVEALLDKYDVWINGVRAEQNSIRSNFRHEEVARRNTLRFHPILDWTAEEMNAYIRHHQLPVHPLEKKGYRSIGCEPCTKPVNGDNERDARWTGMKKTECGLHLGLGAGS